MNTGKTKQRTLGNILGKKRGKIGEEKKKRNDRVQTQTRKIRRRYTQPNQVDKLTTNNYTSRVTET